MANTITTITDESLLRSIIDGSITEFEDNEVTSLKSYKLFGCTNLTSITLQNATSIDGYAYANCSNLTSINAPNLTQITGKQTGCPNLMTIKFPKLNQFNSDQVISNTKVTSLVFPNFTGSLYSSCIDGNSLLEVVDIYSPTSIPGLSIRDNTALDTIIIRSSTLVPLSSVNAFRSSKFDNSTGGTLYVPQSLITEYQNATNWSTILAYTNNQILPIEGSIYENYYADGTPIGLSGYGLIGYYAVGESGRYEEITNLRSHIKSNVENDYIAYTCYSGNPSGYGSNSNSNVQLPESYYQGYGKHVCLCVYSPTAFMSDCDVFTVEFSSTRKAGTDEYISGTTWCSNKGSVNSSTGTTVPNGSTFKINNVTENMFLHKIIEYHKDGTIKTYINGVLKQTRTGDTTNLSNMNWIAMGYSENATGYLGPVAIYNRALTSDEIAEHYQFYVDNYMVGQTAYDSSGNFVGA